MTITGLILLLGTDQVGFGLMLLTAMVFVEIPQLLNARHLVHSRNNQTMARCLARAQKYKPSGGSR